MRRGKLDLIVSVRGNATESDLSEWKEAFTQANRLLFDATRGQHQLGTILVCNNWTGQQIADVWLLTNNGLSSSAYLGLGDAGAHIILRSGIATQPDPEIIVHEIGHYVYGLKEEHIGSGGNATCMRSSQNPGCFMELANEPNEVNEQREFCNPTSHETANATQQSQMIGQSCWATMVGRYPAGVDSALSIPSSSVGPSTDVPDISWVLLNQQQHFAVVIDRSGSMFGDRLAEAKLGATWWVDAIGSDSGGVNIDNHAVPPLDARFALISFATDASKDFPNPPTTPSMASISDANVRASAIQRIGGLVADGLTAIGEGLHKALDQFPASSQSTNPIVVLLTDGFHNQGRDPSTALPRIAEKRVRLFIIGVGNQIEANRLQNLAHASGGEFRRINTRFSLAEQAFQIRQSFHAFSAQALENVGLVASLPESSLPEGVTEFLVEQGSLMATFLLSWSVAHEDSRLFLQLTSPSGETIEAANSGTAVRIIGGEEPYMAYQVDGPEPGLWRVRVLKARKHRYQLMAFSRNASVDAALFSTVSNPQPGDRIPLKVNAYFDRLLSNLTLTGTARGPDQTETPLEFSEDGKPDGYGKEGADGSHTAVFQATSLPGAYEFEVVVENDGSAVMARGCEPGEPEVFAIPAFRRQLKLNLIVGQETRVLAAVNPDSGRPGERLKLELKGENTSFERGATEVNLGDGVRTLDVDIEGPESGTIAIEIDDKARPGPRLLSISTPSNGGSVEVEAAFTILQGEPAGTARQA